MVGFGNRIHAFLPPSPRIEFGAITPKGDHLTVNIGGAAVDADQMEVFLRLPEVWQVLPHLENASRLFTGDQRYFGGRFPCGLARSFAGDRFVMVGDAAGLVRAFKGKGVTSAIQTGIRAAQIILHQGISATALRAYYAANRDIMDDLPYGQAMRRLTILASQLGLMDAVLSAARKDAGLLRALFGAVSGYLPYREVVRMAFSPPSVLAIASAVVRGIVSRTE
jgi:flavin-dependent dehydrogenase